MSRPDLYSKIGEAKLRSVITDFYDRVFGDIMIGFLFEGKSKTHLIEREFEFTANFLGGPVAYTGRPIKQAHAKSPIFGGHFERRLQLLRQSIAAHSVDEEVAETWIEHQLMLRSQVTADSGSECKDTLVTKRFMESQQQGLAIVATPSPSVTPQNSLGLTKLGKWKRQ